MHTDQEQQLVTKAQKGDTQAFAVLYKTWVGKIYAYIKVRVGYPQEAEDLTEQVFVKALDGISHFKKQSSFATWLYSIARNQVIDYYRKKDREITGYDLETFATPEEYETQTQHLLQQKRDRLQSILKQLPKQYTKILRLRYMHQMKVADIADMLGIRLSNAKVRLHRALQKAQQIASSTP